MGSAVACAWSLTTDVWGLHPPVAALELDLDLDLDLDLPPTRSSTRTTTTTFKLPITDHHVYRHPDPTDCWPSSSFISPPRPDPFARRTQHPIAVRLFLSLLPKLRKLCRSFPSSNNFHRSIDVPVHLCRHMLCRGQASPTRFILSPANVTSIAAFLE